MALAKPVGLRVAAEDLRQGLFFSWDWPLGPFLDMTDTESGSRNDGELKKLELPAGEVAGCNKDGGGVGYSGRRMEVGDSTRGTGCPS